MKLSSKHSGYTLIELLLALALMAILASLAIPMIGDEDAMNLNSAKQLLVSDIELAQVMAISHPEDSIGVVIQQEGWHIASLDDPATPLLDTFTGEPLITSFGIGSAASIEGVLITTNAIENTIAFDQYGGLTDITQETQVEFSSLEYQALVVINPTTGSIQ